MKAQQKVATMVLALLGIAWPAFGQEKGERSFAEVVASIGKYASEQPDYSLSAVDALTRTPYLRLKQIEVGEGSDDEVASSGTSLQIRLTIPWPPTDKRKEVSRSKGINWNEYEPKFRLGINYHGFAAHDESNRDEDYRSWVPGTGIHVEFPRKFFGAKITADLDHIYVNSVGGQAFSIGMGMGYDLIQLGRFRPFIGVQIMWLDYQIPNKGTVSGYGGALVMGFDYNDTYKIRLIKFPGKNGPWLLSGTVYTF